MWGEGWVGSTIYHLPIWLHGLGILLLLLGAYSFGSLVQRRMLREPCTDSETAIVGAAMALLAFIIGFTFSIALNRYDERRALVLAEANAIGTTYLRAQMVPEPLRSEMLGTIVRYTDTRLALFEAGEDLDELRSLQAESQRELGLLWDQTLRGVRLVEPPPLGNLLMQTVNETIDLAESRRTTYIVRLPRVIVLLVVGFALITSGIAGFTRGGRRHFTISIFIYFMLSAAICLIIDLDRPSGGTIRVLPGPLADTRAGMTEPILAAEAVPARP